MQVRLYSSSRLQTMRKGSRPGFGALECRRIPGSLKRPSPVDQSNLQTPHRVFSLPVSTATVQSLRTGLPPLARAANVLLRQAGEFTSHGAGLRVPDSVRTGPTPHTYDSSGSLRRTPGDSGSSRTLPDRRKSRGMSVPAVRLERQPPDRRVLAWNIWEYPLKPPTEGPQ